MSQLCKKCSTVNEDNFVFCSKCGTRLDGKKPCVRCSQLVPEDTTFCPYCGTRLDGKKECGNCHLAIASDLAYCPQCGASQNISAPKVESVQPSGTTIPQNGYATTGASQNVYAAPAPKVRRPIGNINESGTLANRIYGIISRSMLTAFSLIIFICSFFAFNTVSLDLSGVPKMSFHISAIDYIGALGKFSNPLSGQDAFLDFQNYLVDKGFNSKTSEKELQEMAKDYDVMKILLTKEALETTPSIIYQVTTMSVGMLLYLLATCGLFVFCLVKLIYYIVKKKEHPVNAKLMAVFLAPLMVVFSMGAFAQSLFTTSSMQYGFGSTSIVIIIFSLLGLLALCVEKYVLQRESISLSKAITCTTSFVLGIIMMFTMSSSVMTTTVKSYGSESLADTNFASYTYKIDTAALSFHLAFENVLFSKDQNTEIPKLKDTMEQLNTILADRTISNADKAMAIELLGIPLSMLAFHETKEGFQPLAIMLYFIPFIYIIALAFVSLLSSFAIYSLFSAKKKEKAKLAFNICGLAMFAVMLAFAIVGIANMGSIISQLKLRGLSVGIGAGIIAYGVLALVNLLQSLLVPAFVHKETFISGATKAAPTPNVATPTPNVFATAPIVVTPIPTPNVATPTPTTDTIGVSDIK